MEIENQVVEQKALRFMLECIKEFYKHKEEDDGADNTDNGRNAGKPEKACKDI